MIKIIKSDSLIFKVFIKPLLMVLLVVFVTSCGDLGHILKSPQERVNSNVEHFVDYKKSDLSGGIINCTELTELTVGSSRRPFDVVDYEYHEKHSFKQCRHEIDLMIKNECDHNVRASYYYDSNGVLAPTRTDYFCSEQINNKLKENSLSEVDVDKLLSSSLVKFPSYDSFVNLAMITKISSPKQKLRKGYFAVRIDFGDSLGEKYFLYFNNVDVANYFIAQVSKTLTKG
jgi:hypothetical protein